MKDNLFNEIIIESVGKAYYLFGLDIINENGINRILKHGRDGFAILSANRSVIANDYNVGDEINKDSILGKFLTDNPGESDLNNDIANKWLKNRNKKADKELKSDIEKAGYSYTPVFGGYHGSDSVVDDYEPSFIVYNKDKFGNTKHPDELLRFAIEMCKKYEQDSVLVKMPNENPCYINKDGYKVSFNETDNVFVNHDNEEFFTTTKRSKKPRQDKFRLDVSFPDDNDDYIPKKMLEGKHYCKNISNIERFKRSRNGEIFL